jgi:AraC-like DNA-binding protein
MARPLKEVDEDLIEALARIHCTQEEIAAVVGCSVDTLARRFAEKIEQGKQQGKTSLRRKQFEVAMTGDRAMLIWLGKQFLGQSERQEITGADGAPLTTFLALAAEAVATED